MYEQFARREADNLGTRLSAQPIQRYSGFWILLNRSKYSGSLRLMSAAHFRLLSNRCGRNFIEITAETNKSPVKFQLGDSTSKLLITI